ncbi:MAG: hypothetical protein NT175_05765 [Bacteroidetes bacterium]|nr:hypothetical protein [Bacteroidota bacterium]
MPNDKLLKELLLQNIEKLQVALVSFELSLEKCKRLDLNKPLSFEESETFDSLSSKFGRISDIYIQKVLRTIFELIREDARHIVDMANKAEKLELIENADFLISVRDLRIGGTVK